MTERKNNVVTALQNAARLCEEYIARWSLEAVPGAWMKDLHTIHAGITALVSELSGLSGDVRRDDADKIIRLSRDIEHAQSDRSDRFAGDLGTLATMVDEAASANGAEPGSDPRKFVFV
jgi:hypothetical protein